MFIEVDELACCDVGVVFWESGFVFWRGFLEFICGFDDVFKEVEEEVFELPLDAGKEGGAEGWRFGLVRVEPCEGCVPVVVMALAGGIVVEVGGKDFEVSF